MSEHDDIELKRKLDALPRSIEPPENLWPGIRARIGVRAWWRRPETIRIAALLVLLVGAGSWLEVINHRASTWTYSFRGPRIGTLHPGDSLNSFGEQAQVRIGNIGTMDLGAYTQLRLLEARTGRQRMALRQGNIAVKVDAPPRLFIVETPSGTAVDLGCAYDLDVDSLGTSRIRVTAGWVSFEDHGVSSLIPAGMSAQARVHGNVGTPLREDAGAALRSAVQAFDRDNNDSAALNTALIAARKVDAVTLWHLVQRARGRSRERAADRLIALVSPPAGVSRDMVLRNDADAMQLYWEQLPGTLPITPEWRRRLWLFWLKVAG